MSDVPNSGIPPHDQQPSNHHVPPRQGRRRMLRAGLATAPVLMTLATRPAFGATQCFTPSGFVSMPTSQHGTPTTCNGLTPGYWKNYDVGIGGHAWPAGFFPVKSGNNDATLFTSWPDGSFTPDLNPSGQTFLQVLQTENSQSANNGPPYDVARHLVASVLNIASGFVPVLSFGVLHEIWYEYTMNGYYEPTAGVQWYHSDIVNYLLSTMPG